MAWHLGEGPNPQRNYKPNVLPNIKNYDIPLNDQSLRNQETRDVYFASAARKPSHGGAATTFPYYQQLPLAKSQFGWEGGYHTTEGGGNLRNVLLRKADNGRELMSYKMQLRYRKNSPQHIIWKSKKDDFPPEGEDWRFNMVAIDLN